MLLLQALSMAQFKVSNGEDATDVQSILDLHVSLVADGFTHETENFRRTNNAVNAEQVVAVLNVSSFLCLKNAR